MKRIYLIIGDGRVGKSTLVRSLTGIREASRVPIQLACGSVINVYAWMRSAQEISMDADEVVRQITRPDESAFTDYLLPLRILPANHIADGYQDYISKLEAAGCVIQRRVFVFSAAPTMEVSCSESTAVVANSMSNPANLNSHIVRKVWGWL